MTQSTAAPHAALIPCPPALASDTGALRRQQATTLALLVVGYAGFYLCRANLSVVTPLLVREFGQRGIARADALVRLGTVASIGSLAYAAGKFVAGVTGDLGGGRRNFLLGMAGAVLFTLAFTLGGVGAAPLFTLAWMGNRFLQSFGWPGMMKIAGRSFRYQSYGLAVGVLSLSYLFGDAAARALMGWLLARGLGWRGVFRFDAALLAAWFVVTFPLLRDKPAALGDAEFPAAPGNLYEPADLTDPDAHTGGISGLLGPLLASPAFLIACGLSLAMTLLRETFNNWTPSYFVAALGLGEAAAARNSAWFPLLGGASVILAGWLGDRLGRGGRAAIICGGMALGGAALYALGGIDAAHAGRGVFLTGVAGFLLIGPYSYLAGAISLDFGGCRGAATACGVIDGVGHLAGILAGDTVARVVRSAGWSRAFHELAAVAWGAAALGACFWFSQRRRQSTHVS